MSKWKNILKSDEGQKAFLNYMIKHHGREYALDMGIMEMNPNQVFASLQEELNVNNYEKLSYPNDVERQTMYATMNEEIEDIMEKHYREHFDMR